MSEMLDRLQTQIEKHSALEKEVVKLEERKKLKVQQLKEVEDEIKKLGVDPAKADEVLKKLESELAELLTLLESTNKTVEEKVEKIKKDLAL